MSTQQQTAPQEQSAKIDIKTIDVLALEWFDRVNGNSYFAGNITINYGLPDAKTINMPFQYGYGDHYRDMAFKLLQEKGFIPVQSNMEIHRRYYRSNNIIARHTKHENCKKRELMRFNEK